MLIAMSACIRLMPINIFTRREIADAFATKLFILQIVFLNFSSIIIIVLYFFSKFSCTIIVNKYNAICIYAEQSASRASFLLFQLNGKLMKATTAIIVVCTTTPHTYV